jgi:hypothetical protein
MKSLLKPGRAALALILLLGAACASAPAGERASRPDPNVLTRAELEGTGAATLYEAVRTLRPRWLVGRAAGASFGGPTPVIHVYLNGTWLGGLEVLYQYRPDYPTTLRWMDGVDAAAALPGLGSQLVGGAILIEVAVQPR